MKNARPRIKISYSYFEKVLEAISQISLVIGFAVTLSYWRFIPEIIPVHFDLSGTVDRTGSKSALLGLLAITAFIYILLTFTAQFPHLFNYPSAITPSNARQKYQLARTLIQLIKAETMMFLSLIIWGIIAAAEGRPTTFIVPATASFVVLSVGTTLIYCVRLFRDTDR